MAKYTFTMRRYDSASHQYGESHCPYDQADNRIVIADDANEAHTLAVQSCMFVFQDSGLRAEARADGFVVLDANDNTTDEYQVLVKKHDDAE